VPWTGSNTVNPTDSHSRSGSAGLDQVFALSQERGLALALSHSHHSDTDGLGDGLVDVFSDRGPLG
jgi:hypothetical protein